MASQFALTPEKKRRIAESKRKALEQPEDYDPKVDAPAAPDPFDKTVQAGNFSDWMVKQEKRKKIQGPPMPGPRAEVHRPSGTDTLAGFMGSLASLGGKDYSEAKQDSLSLLGLLPVTGNVMSADDARSNFQEGNYGMAALAAAGILPGMAGAKSLAKKGGKEALAEAMAPGIRAYHGSPHSFDEFDISKIGTGEGAQAYGHGLYFAENEGIAHGYRERLSGPTTINELKVGNRRVGERNGFDYSPRGNSKYENVQSSLIEDLLIDEMAITANPAKVQQIAIDKLKRRVEDYRTEWPEAVPDAQRLLADLSRPGAVSLNLGERPGQMYEVNINADPEKLLDWDKPLTEQPHVLPGLHAAGYPVPKTADLSYLKQKAAESGPESWYALQLQGLEPQLNKTGSEFAPKTPEATEALRQAGIPGIKYADATSRPDMGRVKELLDDAHRHEAAGRPEAAAEARKLAKDIEGSGSRNFVVFDQNLINIVRKYGIAGALGAGLISQEMAQQMQAQGMGGPET